MLPHDDSEQETAQAMQPLHAQAAVSSQRRALIGRALVAFAVFAPALVILGVFLLSQGKIYGYKVHGAKWPWMVADVAMLLVGVLMMRGEDV